MCARERLSGELFEPVLLADWSEAVFLHFAVEPEVLQPFVPFKLDVYEEMAYVSLVAFTMRNMRPRRGGPWGAAILQPIASHEFLNVRTYVIHKGEVGIYFLAEWLPNKLSVWLGPPVFGLPYRLGETRYRHDPEDGFTGSVIDCSTGTSLCYEACSLERPNLDTVDSGSLDEFLLERYSAFTTFLGLKRRFRVWHSPWHCSATKAVVHDATLLSLTGAWADAAHLIGAHYSPGFRDVWMSLPRFV